MVNCANLNGIKHIHIILYYIMNDFEKIGKQFKTDKILHGYQRFYHKELNFLRNHKFGMIEIGFGLGNSMPLWKSYFEKAKIYIMDDRKEYNDNDRCIVYKGDQSNITDIKNFVSIIDKENYPICFINDDGSHEPEHQLFTFDYLFSNVLIQGGIYIIEDIETSYSMWQKTKTETDTDTKIKLYYQDSIIEKFKLLIDYTNKCYISPEEQIELDNKTNFVSDETKKNILSISFQQNCIIIKKKEHTDYLFDERTYINKYLQGDKDTWN